MMIGLEGEWRTSRVTSRLEEEWRTSRLTSRWDGMEDLRLGSRASTVVYAVEPPLQYSPLYLFLAYSCMCYYHWLKCKVSRPTCERCRIHLLCFVAVFDASAH